MIVKKGARLLLVDDNELIRDLMKDILLMIDQVEEVETAENGLEALETLKSAHYDLVVTDLSMPKMGGLELIRRLREQESSSLILVLSMKAKEALITEVYKADVQGILQKNAPIEEIHNAVLTILNGGTCYDAAFSFLPRG